MLFFKKPIIVLKFKKFQFKKNMSVRVILNINKSFYPKMSLIYRKIVYYDEN